MPFTCWCVAVVGSGAVSPESARPDSAAGVMDASQGATDGAVAGESGVAGVAASWACALAGSRVATAACAPTEFARSSAATASWTAVCALRCRAVVRVVVISSIVSAVITIVMTTAAMTDSSSTKPASGSVSGHCLRRAVSMGDDLRI